MEGKVETVKFLHMNNGHGDSSYAQNSSLIQKKAQLRGKPMLGESISQLKIIPCQTYCIADLGCSAGPNALSPAETIIQAVENKYASEGIPVPEFQVLFNDLPSSDFNSLFRSLSPAKSPDSAARPCRSYLAAGVPGSFYGRLAPRNSLHFVHSSFSLHWLSQVPDEVTVKDSEAWNRGRIFLSKDSPQAAAEAYVRQFQKDFSSFLRSRAQEVVPGGRMFLLFLGRLSADPKEHGAFAYLSEILERGLRDLASQGVIEEEKIHSFNLPVFSPCVEEVRKEVEAEGSFKIERLELLSTPMSEAEEEEEIKLKRENFIRKYLAHHRAVFEVILNRHFGEAAVDKLFDRCIGIVDEMLSERADYLRKGGYLTAVLERI